MHLIGIEINDMASVPALAGANSARDVATTSHAGYTSVRGMAGYAAKLSEPSVKVRSCAPTSTLRAVCSVKMLGMETLMVCLSNSSMTL